MAIFVITGIVFALAFIGLSAGYLLKGRCFSGTCGSKPVNTPDGRLVCPSCGVEKTMQKGTNEEKKPPARN